MGIPIAVGLVGHLECSTLQLLVQEGLIINLGSVAALEPMKSTPVYAASKFGIRGWSLSCYEVILACKAIARHLLPDCKTHMRFLLIKSTQGHAILYDRVAFTLMYWVYGCRRIHKHTVRQLYRSSCPDLTACSTFLRVLCRTAMTSPNLSHASYAKQCIDEVIRHQAMACHVQALRQHNVKVVCIHPAAVNTPMTEGMFVPERCLQPSDIAEAAMLAVRTSPACVPQEITLRLTLSAVK